MAHGREKPRLSTLPFDWLIDSMTCEQCPEDTLVLTYHKSDQVIYCESCEDILFRAIGQE